MQLATQQMGQRLMRVADPLLLGQLVQHRGDHRPAPGPEAQGAIVEALRLSGFEGGPLAADQPVHPGDAQRGLRLAQKPDVQDLTTTDPGEMLDLAGEIDRDLVGEAPALGQHPLQAAPGGARPGGGKPDQSQPAVRIEGHGATD